MDEKWGLLDTKDNVWLGNGEGPNLYGEPIMAKLAAQTASKMLGEDPLRVKVALFEEKNLRKKDTIKAKMTGAQAIKRFEEGGL